MAWDLSFKNLLKRYFEPLGMHVLSGVEVAASGQSLDFLILNNKREAQTPFHLSRKTIIGEFKSNRDRLKMHDFYALLGRGANFIAMTHGYRKDRRKKQETPKQSSNDPYANLWGQKYQLNDVSFALVLGGKHKIPINALDEFSFHEAEKGIFQSKAFGTIDFQVLIIDDLVRYEAFSFAGLFGSSKVRQKTISNALRDDDTLIKSVAYFLYKDEVLRVAKAEDLPLSPESVSIRDAVESLGVKRVVEEVGVKRVVEEVGVKRVVEEVGVKRVVEEVGLSLIINELGVDEFASLLGEDPELYDRLLKAMLKLKKTS